MYFKPESLGKLLPDYPIRSSITNYALETQKPTSCQLTTNPLRGPDSILYSASSPEASDYLGE